MATVIRDIKDQAYRLISREATILDAAAATGASATFDLLGFKQACIQINGINGDTVDFEGSNDDVNFEELIVMQNALTSAVADRAIDTTTDGLFEIEQLPRFVRVNVSAFGSGSITATIIART